MTPRRRAPHAVFAADYLGPSPTELAMFMVLQPIAAEFKSDPSSVACFDLRIVARAVAIVQQFEAHFGHWLKENPVEVALVRDRIEGMVREA